MNYNYLRRLVGSLTLQPHFNSRLCHCAHPALNPNLTLPERANMGTYIYSSHKTGVGAHLGRILVTLPSFLLRWASGDGFRVQKRKDNEGNIITCVSLRRRIQVRYGNRFLHSSGFQLDVGEYCGTELSSDFFALTLPVTYPY